MCWPAARTAAAEADIRLQLARQRVGSSGAAAGASRRLSIRAPMDGHITARTAQPGAQVNVGDALFQIADLSHLALELSLPSDRAAEVETGSTIVVTSGSRSADGTLTFLSLVIDPLIRQVPAIAHLANPDGLWRIGETVSVSVPLGAARAVLAVPQSAVQTVEGQTSVFVRHAEGFKITPIQTGDTAGGWVTVVSDLSADAQIAVRNSFVLKAEAEKGGGATMRINARNLYAFSSLLPNFQKLPHEHTPQEKSINNPVQLAIHPPCVGKRGTCANRSRRLSAHVAGFFPQQND